MEPTLTAVDGELHLGDSILIYRYPEGDCDSIPWPMTEDKWKPRLAAALYGEYECGLLESRTVTLPDGTRFNIDENME